MKNWQLKETYTGDPESYKHHNVVGWKPYMVEIGVFVTANGDKKKEVLDDKREAIRAKREYWEEKREEQDENNRFNIDAHPCTDR